MKRATIAIVLFLLTCATGAAAGDVVRVKSLEASVYEAPGGSSLDIRLHRGSLVQYVDARKGWVMVRLRNGVQGWMPGYSVEIVEARTPLPAVPDPQTASPTPDQPLNALVYSDEALIRNQPTNLLPAASDRTRLGLLPRGVPLRLVERRGHWYRAELAQGRFAWIYDELLDFSAAPPPGRAVLRGLTRAPGRNSHTAILFLDRKAPFVLSASDRNVELRLLGAGAAPGAFPNLPRAAGPFTVRAEWPDTVVVACGLEHSPFGYTARYVDLPLAQGALLVLRVNRARRGPSAAGRLAGYRIALDPGHGAANPPVGYASGTSGPGSLPEHQVNLTVGLAAARYLQDLGAEVILTRTGLSDDMNDLYARTDFAQRQGADLFVSIHANGGPPSARGLEVYWFEDQSRPLAAALAEQLETHIRTGPGKTPFASFAVLRQTAMPAALVEMGYMTNPSEGRLFQDPAFLDACARGIAQGVASYIDRLNFRSHPAFQTTTW